MSSIAELIGQWREQKVNGSGLLRGVVSHPKWTVFLSDQAAQEVEADRTLSALQIHVRPDGQKWLMLFSSSETLDVYVKANAKALPAGQRFLTILGTWIFKLDLGDIDRIWIDPFNAHDIFYERSQFALLREMADAVQVEEALLGLRQGNAPPNALQHAREYKKYVVMVKFTEGKSGMVMAPDNKGRRLAAIFTTMEAFEVFAREVKDAFGDVELRLLPFDGVGLFKTLEGMNLDGFVFNCSGPATPVAFAQRAAAIFLNG
jgi:hypothetical protein